jgi:predicted extracellular nuclease
MIKFLQPLLGVLLFSGVTLAQNSESLLVVSYNVENLFDINDDEIKKDEDFTPEGKYNWTQEKYSTKLKNISKVISSIDSTLPDIISLIEIENHKVLEDLVKQESLKKGNYKIIHEESPDIRGIDVAFLYKENSFDEISHNIIRLKFPFNEKIKTRDILHVHGILKATDTVHFFINHWPSRRGGLAKSEPKRTYVASILRAQVDSILEKDRKAKIIIMGDFNDNPIDKSLFEVLKANNIRTGYNKMYLYNLLFDTFNFESIGTYVYKNNYNMLDHIILSQSWFKGNGYTTKFDSGKIFSPEWLCVKNKELKKPLRTLKGSNYIGGYSDHFPVYFVLTKNTE